MECGFSSQTVRESEEEAPFVSFRLRPKLPQIGLVELFSALVGSGYLLKNTFFIKQVMPSLKNIFQKPRNAQPELGASAQLHLFSQVFTSSHVITDRGTWTHIPVVRMKNLTQESILLLSGDAPSPLTFLMPVCHSLKSP